MLLLHLLLCLGDDLARRRLCFGLFIKYLDRIEFPCLDVICLDLLIGCLNGQYFFNDLALGLRLVRLEPLFQVWYHLHLEEVVVVRAEHLLREIVVKFHILYVKWRAVFCFTSLSLILADHSPNHLLNERADAVEPLLLSVLPPDVFDLVRECQLLHGQADVEQHFFERVLRVARVLL